MRIPDVELGELRYFHAVATAGSFAEGARRSHVSAPAVSKAIKKLEAHLEVELFDRSGRKVALTSAGAVLLQHSTAVLEALERLGSAVMATHAELRGELRVGTTEAFAAHALPVALARLVRAHPGLVPQTFLMGPAQVERRLLEGDLDVGLIGRRRSYADGLRAESLVRSPTSIVCGVGHPLYGVEAVDPERLREHAFVASRFFGQPESVGALVPGPVGATVERPQMAIQMVVEGPLLGVFPDVMIRCQLNHGELYQVPTTNPLPELELVALTRPASASHPSAEALLSVLEPALEESLERQCATSVRGSVS